METEQPWRVTTSAPQAFPSLAVYINIARLFYTVGLNGTITGVVMVVYTLIMAVALLQGAG